MKNRSLYLAIVILLVSVLAVGCAGDKKKKGIEKAEVEEIEETNDKPVLKIGYIFSNHQAPLIIAATKNEGFKDEDIYLKEIVQKEKYVLMSDDEEKCNIELVAAKNGEEIMTMMIQNELQMGISPIEAALDIMNEKNDIKILGPINVDGIGLVISEDLLINDADGFIEYARGQNDPIRIGYQASDTIPVIFFQAAMKEMGISTTENPDDMDKDILLIDLKGTANLIPSLTSELVDGWIGSSPFPELAEVENTGKIVLDIRDLPPEDRWGEFPSSVITATDESIEEYYEELEQFLRLMTIASEYANDNKAEVGKLVADWIGVSELAAINTTATYTTEPSSKWLNNVNVVFEYLKYSGKSQGELKDKVFYFDDDLQ